MFRINKLGCNEWSCLSNNTICRKCLRREWDSRLSSWVDVLWCIKRSKSQKVVFRLLTVDSVWIPKVQIGAKVQRLQNTAYLEYPFVQKPWKTAYLKKWSRVQRLQNTAFLEYDFVQKPWKTAYLSLASRCTVIQSSTGAEYRLFRIPFCSETMKNRLFEYHFKVYCPKNYQKSFSKYRLFAPKTEQIPLYFQIDPGPHTLTIRHRFQVFSRILPLWDYISIKVSRGWYKVIVNFRL